MNMKNLTLEIAVVLACYLVMTMPVASATTINIRFNGQLMESVEYEPSNIVNQHITYVRDPHDINWANVRVAITLNSASLAHMIKRVYLYKCGSLSPVGCMQKTPEVFDTYVDTEIAWDDIGQQVGSSSYPEEGNLLFLVKLEDSDGLTSWVGLWNTIRRNSHREFLFYRHELSDLDIHASSSRLVGPIASYIQNFNVIPFGWLTRVAFDEALSISAIGGDDRDLDTSPPALQTAEPATNEITVINKENYFVFPETVGGTAFPITLEQNPDFQCGDGQCESSLGENEETCCYDCGCEQPGYYCDAPFDSPGDGACRDESLIGLDVVGTPTADISDCSQSFEVGVTAGISSTPASMEEDLSAIVTADGKNYGAQCTESSQGRYQCVFTMSPTIECGSVDKAIASNELKLTINYRDGSERVTRDLTEGFPTISLNYDCSCPDDGDYCDTGTETCEPEDSITLSITELNSYLSPYNPGDTIDLTAKISNPPTGTVLMSASANFTLTGGDVYPGSPECTGPNEEYEYECKIQFSITGYSKESDYRFYPNYLTFDITYNDGPDAATRILTTEFGPISIPNQDCGNGVCDADETTDTCCQDCGCEESNYYCDVSRGCSSLDGITLSTTTYPVELEDCTESHGVEIQASIENAPYGVTLDYTSITVDNQPVSWGFDCTSQVGGVFNCDLGIPPIEGCELPYYTLGPNGLTFTISFPNGDDDHSSLTKELNASFDSIRIIPVPHIDGECEAELGENGITACLDCPCDEDPAFGGEYYCDASLSNPGGTCLPKSDVALVVESPTSPVTFDSCERYNKLSVLMHVRNQPSGMDAENVYATLGGEAASYVSCRESAGTYLDSNITFNCSIRIPPIDTCTQDQTYNHANNSISLIISYDNGEQGTVLQTLNHDLPDVYIHQTYKSLHEITENAMEQMTEVLDRIMQITEDTMDVVYTCIELQIVAFIMNIGLSIVLGYAAGKPETAGGDFNWKDFGEGVQAGGNMGMQFSNIIGQICDALEKIQQIMIKYQELLMEKIKMEMCLAMMQHAMDAGDCKGNEQGCFDQIIGCLSNLNDMTNIMNDIDKLTDGINKDFVDASNSIVKIGDAISEGPWSEGVSEKQLFGIKLQDTLSDNCMVCEYNDFLRKGESNECRTTDTTGYVSIGLSTSDCSKARVVLTVNEKVVLKVDTGGKDVSTTRSVPNLMGDLIKDQLSVIQLYCTDENPVEGITIDTDSKYKPIGAPLNITRGVPDSSKCSCTYGGATFVGVNKIPSTKGGVSPSQTSTGSVCNWESNTEFWMKIGSYLGKFTVDDDFIPYNNGKCEIPIGQDVIIKTTNDIYRPGNGNNEYWYVEVKTPEKLKDCGDSTTGYMLACKGSSRRYATRWAENPSTSDIKKKTDGPETEVSTVINAVGVEENVPVFVDTSTDDTQQAICTIPAGTIIEIYGHSCKDDEGEIKKLWINFNIDTEAESAGSASDPCEKYGQNNRLNSYWAPMFDVWECDKWSLQELLEMYDGLAGYAYSGGESSETGNPGERISFEDGEDSNFVYKLICKLARKLSNDPDSFSYYSEQSQYDIKDWECTDAVVCHAPAICGVGFFLCPLKGFDWIYPDGKSYGTQKMDKLIDMCELKPHTMMLCKDAKIPCADDYGCNNIFEGSDNKCVGDNCDYQEADFYFKCSDVAGSQ